MNFKFFILFYFILSLKVFSQYNYATNAYEEPVKKNKTATVTTYNNNNNLTGITCNPNGFFAIDGNGNIDEFIITGSTVTYTNIMSNAMVNSSVQIVSLAYGNNLLSTFSKTFYGSSYINVKPIFYDGVSWIDPTPTYTSNIFNCGAYDNYVYYQSTSSSAPPKVILKFDGISLTQVYYNPQKQLSVADLAVDNQGNVWFLTSLSTSPFISDSLLVVSPAGQIINQLPFSYNMYSAYGSFILNNVFYIGIGSGNSTSPNVLLPLSIVSNSVNIGTPIVMPANNYYDLAGCDPGYILGVKSNSVNHDFSVYPNPCTDFLELDIENNEQNMSLKIINVLGQVVIEEMVYDKKNKINVQLLSNGIYFLQIQYASGQRTIKFIKE